MALNPDSMERLLESYKWTPRNFAAALNLYMEEAYQLLGGEKVGYYPARSFIEYYGASFATNYIDWPAMGMEDPMPRIRAAIITEETLRKQRWRAERRREKFRHFKEEVELKKYIATYQ